MTTNTTGSNNVAVGQNSLLLNTTASNNTALGAYSLENNTTGTGNTAVGLQALQDNTTANNNTSIGFNSLLQNTTGTENTVMGSLAGDAITTGSTNTFVGKHAGGTVTTGSGNTIVGRECTASAAEVNNEFVIGENATGSGTATITIGIGSTDAVLNIDGSDTSWAASSDERLKENIKSATVGLGFIEKLRPITYNWKAKKDVSTDISEYYEEGSEEPCRGTGGTFHGFVAQEVKAVIDEHSDEIANKHNIWSEDTNGVQQIAFGNMMPMAIKAIQELSTQVDELKQELKTLKGE